jgi:hypothetical protein
MALTKDGNLGIGITNPTHKLNVQGISTFTDAAYFESTLETGGDLTVGGNLLFGSSSNITATLRGNVESGNGGNVVLIVPAGNDNPVENAEIKARVVGGASTITWWGWNWHNKSHKLFGFEVCTKTCCISKHVHGS